MTIFTIPPGLIELPDDLPPGTYKKMAAGTYEAHKTALISALQPGDVFVDVGAHVGYHSLWALKAGAVVAVYEPVEDNLQRCVENFLRNGFRRFMANGIPVWHTVEPVAYFTGSRASIMA